jgi:hypothetical protein
MLEDSAITDDEERQRLPELRYWVGIIPYSYHNIQNTVSVPITQRSIEGTSIHSNYVI